MIVQCHVRSREGREEKVSRRERVNRCKLSDISTEYRLKTEEQNREETGARTSIYTFSELALARQGFQCKVTGPSWYVTSQVTKYV